MKGTRLNISEARAILLADEALQLSYEERQAGGQTFGIEEREAWIKLVESANDRIKERERSSTVTPYPGGNEPGFQTLFMEAMTTPQPDKGSLVDLAALAATALAEVDRTSPRAVHVLRLNRIKRATHAVADQDPGVYFNQILDAVEIAAGPCPCAQCLPVSDGHVDKNEDSSSEKSTGFILKRLTAEDAAHVAEVLRVSIEDKHWLVWHPKLREIREKMIERLEDYEGGGDECAG